MIVFLYLLLLIFGLIVPISIALFGFFAILGDLKGAPFVPTQNKLLDEILAEAKLKTGQQFLELGSGDGRVTRLAVDRYGVVGKGIEINLMLVWYSNLRSKLNHLEASFSQGDFFKTNFGQTDIIFVFLLPKTLKKLAPKFLKECKKATLIISHGFKIKGLESKLVKTQSRKLFSTHFYRL